MTAERHAFTAPQRLLDVMAALQNEKGGDRGNRMAVSKALNALWRGYSGGTLRGPVDDLQDYQLENLRGLGVGGVAIVRALFGGPK